MAGKMGSGSVILILVLIPVSIVSILVFVSVYTFEPGSNAPVVPVQNTAQDTVNVVDTLPILSSDFELMIHYCCYLDLCVQRITVPLSQRVSGEGILNEIADIVTDVTLEMFTSVPVEIHAGVDISAARILDYTIDAQTGCISWMQVYLPDAEITYSRVDYSENPVTHYQEGHVNNSMVYIMNFLVNSADSAEIEAREVAISSGILNEANRRCAQEIRFLLGSVGVREVEFVSEEDMKELPAECDINLGGM